MDKLAKYVLDMQIILWHYVVQDVSADVWWMVHYIQCKPVCQQIFEHFTLSHGYCWTPVGVLLQSIRSPRGVQQEFTRSASGVHQECIRSTDLLVRDLGLKSPKQNVLTRVWTLHHYMIMWTNECKHHNHSAMTAEIYYSVRTTYSTCNYSINEQIYN